MDFWTSATKAGVPKLKCAAAHYAYVQLRVLMALAGPVQLSFRYFLLVKDWSAKYFFRKMTYLTFDDLWNLNY